MASSKNTGLHLALVFFVMLSAISGVAAIIMYNQTSEDAIALAGANDKASKADQERRRTLDQLATFKKLTGYDTQESFGESGPDNDPLTTTGAIGSDLKKYTLTSQPANLAEALANLHAELAESRKNMSALDLANQNLQSRYDQLDADNQQDLAGSEAKRAEAEAGRRAAVDTTRAQLATMEGSLKSEITKNGELQAGLDAKITELVAFKQMHFARMKQQKIQMTRLNKELDKITRPSFEKADGRIVTVDRRAGTVTVNLGFAHKLPLRLSMSVYKKSHQGIGRQGVGGKAEDIKGAIEITRIAGTRLAEARIADEDIFELIRPGDPVYTPLWAPGISESFSFVGVFDIDNDGRPDNKKLHELATVAGAKIVSETDETGAIIDENGEILDGSSKKLAVDHRVKFLVIGDFPDPTEGVDDEDTAMRMKLAASRKLMQEQALDHGVRLVRMNDFLAFIGYKPDRRIYRPGDNRPYTLKYGSRSTGVSQTDLRVPKSSGNTAGRYSGKKARGSQGNSTKIFRGGANKY